MNFESINLKSDFPQILYLTLVIGTFFFFSLSILKRGSKEMTMSALDNV